MADGDPDFKVVVVEWLQQFSCVKIGNIYYISPQLAEYLIEDD